MIPRTVLMAQEVAAQFTPTELDDYGNIILNGYQSLVPNTVNKKAWQYAETLTPPVDLPFLFETRPALKGWTTNYAEYYTQLQPNGYGVNPGDPTMFEYDVHSFTPQTGSIDTIGGNGLWISGGRNYTVGIYLAQALTGGNGTGATADIVVGNRYSVTGPIVTWFQTSGGEGYPAGVSVSEAYTYAATGNGVGATFSGTGSFSAPFGFLVSALVNPGTGYKAGDILAITGGTEDALVQITTVGVGGTVTSVTIVNPGLGYEQGDALSASIPGGTGFYAPVGSINPTPGTGGVARWSQVPHRYFQNQVGTTGPNPSINYPDAIPYSFMYPVADSTTPPPIDTL